MEDMPPKARDEEAEGEGEKIAAAEAKEWGHAEGMPLEEVQVDAMYDGVVTNVGKYGVFVDFGAVKDGLLRVPIKIGRAFKRGMEVKGLSVLSCDAEAGKVVLQMDEEHLPDPPPKKKPPAGGGTQGDGKRGGGQPRQPREWGHEGAVPLEELSKGDKFEGTVTNVSPSGVFVDIGAVRDARLSVPARIGRRFRIGDVVQDVTLESVDVEQGRMAAILPDPEAAVQDLPPKERATPKPKAAPKPKAKGKSKAKAKAKSQAARAKLPAKEVDYVALEDLKVGAVVDGVVCKKTPYDIFVDIGVGKDAKLQVPRKIGADIKKGDELIGMRVEYVDIDDLKIAVTIEDPEIQGEEEVSRPPLRKTGRGAARRTASEPPVSRGSGGGRGGGAAPAARQQQAAVVAQPTAKKRAGSARPKAAAATAPEPKGRHPNGLPVKRFRPGGIADGVVTRVTTNGVFINIGAVVDGFLRLSPELAKQFQARDEVHGMVVDTVDAVNERLTLQMDEPELEEPAPAPPARGAGKAKAKAKGKAKAQAKTQAAPAGGASKDWSHPDGMQVADMELGSEMAGSVTNSGNFGVFVDVGAVKDGRLQVPRGAWRQFRKGTQLEGLVVDTVDAAAGQFTLVLPEGYELDEVEALPPKPKAAPRPKRAASAGPTTGGPAPRRLAAGASSSGGGAAKAKGKAKAAATSRS